MCTVVILRRPDHDWPVILAANRDERTDRPWLAPARHWGDRPEVVAGKDQLAGGSWLGMNDYGVVAGVMNRWGTLGSAPDRRSRGELVLEALDHGDAVDAVTALKAINPRAFRPFNMIVADNMDAFFVAHRDSSGQEPISVARLEPGLTMITSGEPNDPDSPRIQHFLPLFRRTPPPDPDAGDFVGWDLLLASPSPNPERWQPAGMCFETEDGFGTLSSALIALPSPDRGEDSLPVFRYTPGPPDRSDWQTVDLT